MSKRDQGRQQRLNGELITLGTAERLVRAVYPGARCRGSTGFDGQRDYGVYLHGGRAGEMYRGSGTTKAAAWRSAAVYLAEGGVS
jgi:hypothetical protein